LGYLSEKDYSEMRVTLDNIGRMLIGLTHHLENSVNREP
jgi:hypothetical protein